MDSVEKQRVPQTRSKSPEEEIAYLSERVRREQGEHTENEEKAPHVAAEQVIDAYEKRAPHEVLDRDMALQAHEIEELVLGLTPEHDRIIDELLAVLEEKGIKNALSVVDRMENPHIRDDFHRFLVQYLIEAGDVPGVKEGSPVFKALDTTLFEITFPAHTEEEQARSLRELIASMEQFYAGMFSVSSTTEKKALRRHFTLEVAVSRDAEEIIFYAAVPTQRTDLFEKQLFAIFPDASITERRDDYNPFYEGGASVGSSAAFAEPDALPIALYDMFEYDPLNVLLTAFSKLNSEGEGAAFQLCISPSPSIDTHALQVISKKVKEGSSLKEATRSGTATFAHEFGETARDIFFGPREGSHDNTPKKIDEQAAELVGEKAERAALGANIRLVASAQNRARAEAILHELESAFNQFSRPGGNELRFSRVPQKKLARFLHAFSFRMYQQRDELTFNTKELATLFHFPVARGGAAHVKESRTKTAEAPAGLSKEGIVLGENVHRGTRTPIHFADEDRLRHFYTIGQTGTGKTTLLKHMIAQDMARGEGVCMIDPHGSDIQDVLAAVPKERIRDVIYFDPARTDRVMGLNMLEYDSNHPEQKTFVVDELLNIFRKLYGSVPESVGPVFEQYFRNAGLLVVEDPSSGGTLLDIARVLSDERFRALKLSRCKNPVVTQFWQDIATKAGGESALANIVPYITSKFDVFMANEIMRPIITQEHSAFDFRAVMDEKKILLVNLSKGKLGDINAHLLGLIIVGKILMAALSRVDTPQDQLASFYLYIDEFQNITTDSIETILSEARKYRLGLSIAHQFIGQLEEGIRDAVFGNVGSMAAFRVGSEDAETLAPYYEPTFTAADLARLENQNAYVKLLTGGYPQQPFSIKTASPPVGTPEAVEKIKELSALQYGRPREDVERELQEKYKSTRPSAS